WQGDRHLAAHIFRQLTTTRERTGDHHDRCTVSSGAHGADQPHPVETRHIAIREHEIEVADGEHGQRFLSVSGAAGTVTGEAQYRLIDAAQDVIVVDDKNAGICNYVVEFGNGSLASA